MRVTTLKNEASTADQIVLNADGSFGGELATQLGSKLAKADGYAYNSTVYFTANGTFTKATYPWLRAIRVKTVGAGGGSGGAATTGAGEVAAGAGGGGGAYAESFITDIAGLSASVTVTVGAGGAGGAAGANAGSTGGDSSFGSAVIAKGGNGGAAGFANTAPTMGNGGATGGSASDSTGDLKIGGVSSHTAFNTSAAFPARPMAGFSHLSGNSGPDILSGGGANGATGFAFGGGAVGGINAQNQATARSGAAGGAGIVIVELFA